MARRDGVRVVELRVLDGPNLYFPRPAIKLTLVVDAWLDAPAPRVARVAERLAVRTRARALQPGEPRTDTRRRFVGRILVELTRAIASRTGTSLAVRVRTGAEPEELVIAFPWRRRGAAEALATEVAWSASALLDTRRRPERVVEDAARRVRATAPGDAPSVPAPVIPVVAVTGTNGKTTTVRLLAAMVRAAGKTVAFSSTDGVYLDGRLVEAGDYSGFGGAARALAQPGVEVAILETARGGILLRGIGATHNDVAVVTNVSADHLGLHGIRTIDQLAEVKATITRITRPDGWDVLNADDPRVLAMRRGISGRPWLFSMDPDHPAIRALLAEHGRATTIVDHAIAVLSPGHVTRPLVSLLDVPMTLAGISTNHTYNAMAAASAALAVGLPERAVVRALRSFVLDAETNPGRANLYEVDGRIVVIDYAHNEAGMRGMTEICRGLRARGRAVWLAFGTAGDRSDDILHDLGYTAARGADHVAVAELLGYLRGRDRTDIVERLRAGAIDGGAADVPVYADEVTAVRDLLARAGRGDIVAVTALGQRAELFALMKDLGGAAIGPRRVRALVRRARGSDSPRRLPANP